MTAIEAVMADHERPRDPRSTGLARPADPAVTAALSQATEALDRFLSLHAQVVALSRRNTDVRSMALVLGSKPAVIAECAAPLSALIDALAKRDLGGTR